MNRSDEIQSFPIFPLPLVLFPGEMLPLHIFEPRYRAMMRDIGPDGGRFGVVYFEPTDNFVIRPDETSIGTIAEVASSESLEDGRSNITVVGIRRFRLIEYHDHGNDYLTADIATFSDEEKTDDQLLETANAVVDLFERLTVAVGKMHGAEQVSPDLRSTDPETLSYIVAATIGGDNEQKYALLTMTDTDERLSFCLNMLRRNIETVEHSVDVMLSAKTNGHSKKKLDI